MSKPVDQAARDRFANRLDRNFSVLAAAGSGKTRALADRILSIAKHRDARGLLPRLVVVTYTNRAANEMQQRTRAEILKGRLDVEVLSAFNRAFFGTIHSFCVRLLEMHGHFLGLPPQLELVTNDEELWNDFVQRQEVIGRGLTDNARAVLLRYVEVRKLFQLAQRGGISADATFSDGPCPDVNIDALLRYEPGGSSLDNITRTQENLRAWERARLSGSEFFPLPLRGSSARDFVRLWEEAFGPFRDWLSRAALCVAAELERDYRSYRLASGTLTYPDQVAFALQLFENSEAARRIRAQQYRVILDEAQDTSPAQFGVLVETTRPPDARGLWPREPADPPQPGHFCMVGDRQQAIYSHQDALTHYERVHEALVAAPGGETVDFSVSFRLDDRAVKFLNETFSQILQGSAGQVAFLKMHPRGDVLPGQVVRIDFAGHNFPPRTPVRRKAAWEARELARWIRATGLEKLRAGTWRNVAVVCPRKLWFGALRDALLEQDLAVEVQSETAIKGENPAYAWLSALLTVLADSSETYETAGVLREVFGLSDHDLALFAGGNGWRLDFRRAPDGADIVARTLRVLNELHDAIEHQPLFSAVREVIARLKLRERLHTLPARDFDRLDEELDALLAAAARAETDGMSLYDFARFLRDDFLSVREPPAATRADAIQVITSHKAKGSEWHAVIVPFLTREVDTRTDNFPRLTTDVRTGLQRILFDIEEVTKEMETETKLVQAQEMERLLYVALTRAKHTLVLASAPGLYARTDGTEPSRSQIKWLRCEAGGCNETAFSSLENDPCTHAGTAAAQEQARDRAEFAKVPELPNLDPRAANVAAQFVESVSPSGLAEGALREEIRTPSRDTRVPLRAGAFDNEATRYGQWWHQLVRSLDWRGDPTQWDHAFAAALPRVNDIRQAEREWQLLRAHTGSAHDFRKHFGDESVAPHAEFPFLLKLGDRVALEGVIDLILLAPGSKRALIIDWKTNRIEENGARKLQRSYAAQIASYWKAVATITGFNVEAALFSTALGELCLYEPMQLAAEWARLQQLPPDELNVAFAADVEP